MSRFVGPGSRGGSGGRAPGSRHQAEEAECPPCFGWQSAVRKVERGPDRHALLTLHVQSREAPPFGEVSYVVADAARPVIDPGAGDAERERQTVAEFHQPGRGFQVGRDSIGPDRGADQLQSLPAVEHIAGHSERAVQSDEPIEFVTTGHKRE